MRVGIHGTLLKNMAQIIFYKSGTIYKNTKKKFLCQKKDNFCYLSSLNMNKLYKGYPQPPKKIVL